MTEKSIAIELRLGADTASHDAGGGGADVGGIFAEGTLGVAVSGLQNALLSSIEARLTHEVTGLIRALGEFGSRAQLIREEIPVEAECCKLVTGFLALVSLQLANTLGEGLDKPIFFDDGALYLSQLNLSLDDFIREIDLDGRRFLAISFIEKGASKVFDIHQKSGDSY
jgi:hypothetical protein